MKSIMCVPSPTCFMVSYMDVADANNSSSISAKTPWNFGGVFHHHESPLSFYLPMMYSYALDHSVTVSSVKNFFIGTPFGVTHWKNFI